MEAILTLMLIGMVIYMIYLSSRVSKLENFLAGKTAKSVAMSAPAQVGQSAQTAQVVKKTAAPQVPMKPLTPTAPPKSFIDYLPKVGVVALLFGIGFFLKYAIDQGWIGIWMRLIIGGVIGTLLIVLYSLWKDKYQKYAIVLAGGGLAIWYLTIYAAVQMYGLVGSYSGLVILAIITIITLFLAEKNKSMPLSVIAWSGAFLSPIILAISTQSLPIFMAYLLILTIGLFLMVVNTKSNLYFIIQLVGIAINLIWTYFVDSQVANFYSYYLFFFFVQLTGTSLMVTYMLQKQKDVMTDDAKKEYSAIYFTAYVLFALPAMMIVRAKFVDYSVLAAALTGVWTYIVYAITDRLENKTINYLLSGLGAVLLTFALGWQFSGNTQIITIYALGLLGVVIGALRNRPEIRVWGLCVVMFGILLAIIAPYGQTSGLIFSVKFGMEMLGVVALGIAYVLFKEDQITEFEKDIHKGLLYIISGLVWFLVTWDIVNFFNFAESENQRNLLISLWWLVWAVILIVGSVVSSLKPLRKVSLLLFGLVILKVFLYDVGALEISYRIISFISLGAILLIVSFAYQHNKEKIKQYLQ